MARVRKVRDFHDPNWIRLTISVSIKSCEIKGRGTRLEELLVS